MMIKNFLRPWLAFALIIIIIVSFVQFGTVAFASDDIRFDFDSELEGVGKYGTIIDTVKVEDGIFVATVNKSKDLKSKQLQITLPSIDFGTGGYYMHVRAKYEFSEGVTFGSHFADVFESETQQYGTVVGTSWKPWTGYKTNTYDISSYTGTKWLRWFIQTGNASGNGTGKVEIDWIAFSKSATPPTATKKGSSEEYTELYKDSDSRAVRLLVSLGIMDYDKDTGLFWDDTPLKRSQMAEIICKLYGLKTEKNSERLFDDVNDIDRAAIETAVLKGYMSGYGDREFGPDDYITGNQLVKIFVSMLGGQSAAERIGGFPDGYFEIGRRLGLKYSSLGILSEKATRLDVANIIYDAMHSDYLDITGAVGDTMIYDTREGETFLTESLDIYQTNGIMSADDATTLRSPGGLGENCVMIDGHVMNDPKGLTDGFLGCNVLVYEKRVEENSPGDIIYIEETSQNNVLEIDGKMRIFEDIKGKKVTYYQDNKSKYITLANAVDMVYNGIAENFSSVALDADIVDEFKFIDNDDDGKYDVVVIYAYDDYMTNIVHAENMEISLQYDEQILRFEDDIIRIYKDGKPITVEEIQNDQIISVAKSRNTTGDKVSTIKCGLDVFTGKVDSITTQGDGIRVVEIAGKEYSLGDYSEKLILTNKLSNIESGDEATFYLNAMGDISVYVLGANSEDVACLLKLGISEDSIDPKLRVTLCTQDGKIKKFISDDKVTIDGVRKKVSQIVEDQTIVDKLGKKQLVKYKSSGDTLKSLTFATEKYDPTEFSEDFSYGTLKCTRTSIMAELVNGEYTAEKYRFTKDTVTFKIPVTSSLSDGDVDLDEALYSVYKGAPIAPGATGKLQLYDIQEDGTVGYAIWVFNPTGDMLSSDHPIVVVSGKGKDLNKDGDIVDVIYGYDELGAEVEIKLRPDCKLMGKFDINTLDKGDVVQYFNDKLGYVQQIRLRYDSNVANGITGISTSTDSWNEIRLIGKVAFKSNNQFSVYTTDVEPTNPTEVEAIISNTGAVVLQYESAANKLYPIEFDQIEKNDKICAVLNRSNKTRILIVYR